eukprot:gnl/TRDRNA2_/TRDRNA2_41981_c0_seq1.p1 gnl/TRDRNA2_/TRDRNA2_41981_c0~~gnl/TRDRNA2_/TRDRNA2_41981_c0_seq1.p1  ORF type:complete len:421 (-),score=66.40 gnl/TRDRNA2_/TRDRNA2_41981_c0_seq1:70-1332(-)
MAATLNRLFPPWVESAATSAATALGFASPSGAPASCRSRSELSLDPRESHRNGVGREATDHSEWTSTVLCVEVIPSDSGDARAKRVQVGDRVEYILHRRADLGEVLAPHSDARIEACTEWRQTFSDFQFSTHAWLPLYHSFMLLEVAGDYVICTEKYSDKLELMFGPAEIMNLFAPHFHSNMDGRKSSFRQERCILNRRVTIQHLIDWISGPLAIVWKPYSLMGGGNCQDYAKQLQQFLEDPSSADALKSDSEVVYAAVGDDGWRLRLAAQELRDDPGIVSRAVSQSGCALQFASERLKMDRDIVLVAVNQDGRALRYVPPDLQKDTEVVSTAVSTSCKQKDFAGLFATDELRNNRLVVLTAVQLDGRALEFAAPQLKRDRDIVCTAVQHNGQALQFAAPELQRDYDVVVTAVRQNDCTL